MLFASPIFACGIFATGPALLSTGEAIRLAAANPWQSGPYLPLIGNPTNRSGLSPGMVQDAIVDAAQNWHAASGGKVMFDYWQGTDAPTFTGSLEYDGRSTIFFASQDPTRFVAASTSGELNLHTAAFTKTWIDLQTKEIVEIDMVLNDLDFRFVSRTMQASTWPNFLQPDSKTALLEDTLMHEYGHAIGLDHSTNLESTMYTYGWYRQHELSCDDVVAAQSLYNVVAPSSGVLTGAVQTPSGEPILGASVTILSALDLYKRYSAMTDATGYFVVDNLPSGQYYTLVEPVSAVASSFSPYYAGLSHAICHDATSPVPYFFSRQFLLHESTQALRATAIQSDRATDIGVIRVPCAAGSAMVLSPIAGTSIAAAPTMSSLLEINASGRQASWLDTFDTNQHGSRYYKLEQIEGDLELRSLGFSLFSRVQLRLRLLDSAGNEVISAGGDEVLHPAGLGEDYENYDTRLFATALPLGIYYIEVTPTLRSASGILRGDENADATPFAMISVRLSATSSIMPPQTNCIPDRSLFPAYTSPAGSPRIAGAQQDTSGGCQVSASSKPMTLQFLPVGLTLVLGRRRRRRKPETAKSGHAAKLRVQTPACEVSIQDK